MRKIYFTYDKEYLTENARDIFLKISGLDREGKKYERMRLEAEAVGQRVREMFVPKVECLYTDNVTIEDDFAIIDEVAFKCRAFQQLENNSIDGAFIYAVTAGDFQLPEESIINQLYADLWGTAYTDAVRMHIKEQLEEQYVLSDSFGPGFYGMDVAETAKIARIIDFDRLGIELKDNGILVPLKSCTGMFFEVNAEYELLNTECIDCHGNHTSCRLCQINGGR